jgi:hypothetical protein
VLTVSDFACVWVDIDENPDNAYVGVVLRLQHPDLPDSYDQLYAFTPLRAASFISELALYLHPPSPI